MPVEKTIPAKKMKSKAPARPKGKGPAEKRVLRETAESSGDEQVPDMAVQFQPERHLHDGPAGQECPATAVNLLVDYSDTNSPNDADLNKVTEYIHFNADAINRLATRPLSPSSLSPTRCGSADLIPSNFMHAESLVPAPKSSVVEPSSLQLAGSTQPPSQQHADSAQPPSQQCADSAQPPSLQRVQSLAPAAESPIVRPSALQPVAMQGLPALSGVQEHRRLDTELPPALAAHHGRSEPVMEIPRSHYDRRVESEMPTAPRYLPSEYYHDPCIPYPPQPSHGPQPLYHNSRYHDAPYCDSQDGYDGYVKTYWHPPSSLYFGSGGRYQHWYGREYPNEYPKNPEEGGRAP
ncbi:hypothetical protein BDR07DRAFT_1374867 [Suillus spraguei]|nr:hypothetical protein BDR07DRAFT_1374867 [Suillus spraguei]